MADREIRLIGSFKDDITPKLDKLNRRLLGTLKQFEKLQQKIAPVAAEMAKFNTAAAATSGNLKSQRSAIEENIRMLRQYRVELSRTATAQSRMGSIRPPRGPRGGGSGGGGVGPIPPSGGRRPTSLRGGGGDGLGAGIFGVTLGNQLASIITGAVVAGFRTGAQIMMTPFKFGAKALGERIRDEMSDVRTAGGLFSISKRMQKPLFGTFAEAEDYTKEQNRYLAKLAGSLPGDTQEYIQVSKQIADGIFTIVSQDSANATKLAAQLAQTRGASAEEIAKLTAGGPAAQRQAGKELVGEMTKLTVLAGLGGRQGAYGLPQLTERMFAEEQISMGMFQRYAAIFRDPMIKGALERNIDKINKTGKNTTARLDAIRETYAQIVTPDLVRRYQRTTAGVLESLRTTFLNPEVGLLGLGRPLGKAVQKFNEFGQAVGVLGEETVPLANTFEKNGKLYGYVIDKMGRVTDKLVEASMEQISIFDRLRDVFANVMIVLEPIITNLASFFDPLLGIGASLDDVRKATMWFQSTFERYRVTMMKEAERLPKELRAQFEATVPMRSAFQALNNAMVELGAYGDDQFKELSKVIIDPKTKVEEFSSVLRTIVDKFLNSDAAKRIGETIGMIVGTVIAQVGEMMKVAAGLATASKLAEGFAAGFQAAGGPQGFRDIIRSVFALFGKLLIEVIKAAPLESAIVAALFFLPGAIAALIGEALSGGFKRGLGGRRGADAVKGGRLSSVAQAAGRQTTGALSGAAKAIPGLAKAGTVAKMKGVGILAAGVVKMATVAPDLSKVGKSFAAIGKRIPGLNVAFAALDFTLKKIEGKDALQAASEAGGGLAGGIIGGAVGTAILPGIGTAIGSVLGTLLGDWLGSKLPGMLKSLGDFFTQTIPSWWNVAVGGLTSAFSSVWTNVVTFFTSTLPELILGAWGVLVNFVRSLPQKILYGIGVLIGLLQNAWDGLVQFFIVTIPQMWNNAVSFVRSALQTAWNSLVTFFTVTLPTAWSNVINFVISAVQGAWSGFVAFVYSLPGRFSAAFSALIAWLQALPGRVQGLVTRFVSLAGSWAIQVGNALLSIGSSIIDWARGLPGRVWSMLTGAVAEVERGRRSVRAKPQYLGSGSGALMPIGGAVAAEMKKKPPGSDLVVANTSELIVPTKHAAMGQGTIAEIVSPLVSVDMKTSIVAAYIERMRSEVSSSVRQTTSAINSLSAQLNAGLAVRVVNQPTVEFAMSGMGPVGGGIGSFPKTSGYGMRWGKMHTGNDYGMPIGTKLGIGGPGRVLFAGNAGGYGKMMDIGGPGGMVYRFAHLSKFNAPVGAMLPPGFPFALSGNTGRSTGPHLHFEARPGGGGPVPPDAFANIIRANFVGTPFGPLMGAMENEMKGMPYGAQLAVANSDEIFMKPKQMASVIEASTRAGAEGTNNITTGPITISIDGYNQDPKVLTETIASELIAAMYRKSRSEVLTS